MSFTERLSSLLSELRRRRVVRVAIVYAAVAWGVVEVADVVFPALRLPEWAITFVVALVLLGFPVAIVLAWAFEITPDGVRRTLPPTAEVAPTRVEPFVPRWLLVGLGVAAVAGVGGYLAVRQISGLGGRGDSRVGVAVFPFRPTGAAVEDWSEGVADLLATVLDGTQGIRIADPWSLWRSLRPDRTARAVAPDPAQASQLARKAGAHHFVLGSVVGSRDYFDLNVRIYDSDRLEPIHTFTEAGSADSLAAVVQRLAVELITRVWKREQLPQVPELERYATNSADALKAYLDAKAALRRGLVDSADAAIDRSLALDSTFALAMVEAAVIKSWVQFMQGRFYTGLIGIAERAVELSDSLSERNRMRARALLASIRTDGPTAAESAHRIIELDSTDFEGWITLAYYHTVYGWQYGADEQDALAAAEHVVRLDSTDVPGLVRRAWLAVTFEDPDDMGRQLKRLQNADTTDHLVRGAVLGLRAVLAHDRAFEAIADTIAAAPSTEWLTPYRYLRHYSPDRAEMLMERVRTNLAPGEPQWVADGAQARLLVAEGRLAEVDSAIEAGVYGFTGFEKNLKRFLVAATIAGVGDRAVSDPAVEWLAEYIPADPDSTAFYWNTRPVWWTAWLVSAYSAMFGDTMVTRRWQEVIGTFPAGGTPMDYRGGLQADLEARLAARRGDLDSALVFARQAFERWSIHTDNDWEALAEPAMRFHLATLYRATNQPDSAEALLRSLVPPTTWMGFYTARASFELAELAENRGDQQSAARHYRTALRLWERGGPEIASWRERAEAGVERTAGERRAARQSSQPHDHRELYTLWYSASRRG